MLLKNHPQKNSVNYQFIVSCVQSYKKIRQCIRKLIQPHQKQVKKCQTENHQQKNDGNQQQYTQNIDNNFDVIWQQLQIKIKQNRQSIQKNSFQRQVRVWNFRQIIDKIQKSFNCVYRNRSKWRNSESHQKYNIVSLIMDTIKIINEIKINIHGLYTNIFDDSVDKIDAIQRDFELSIENIKNIYRPKTVKSPLIIKLLQQSKIKKNHNTITQQTKRINTGKSKKFVMPQDLSKIHQKLTLATSRPSTGRKSYFTKNYDLKQKLITESKDGQIFLENFVEDTNVGPKMKRISKQFKRSQTAKLRQNKQGDDKFLLSTLKQNSNKYQSTFQYRQPQIQQKIGNELQQRQSINPKKQGRKKISRINQRSSVKNKPQRQTIKNSDNKYNEIKRRQQRRYAQIINEPQQIQKHNEQILKDNPIIYRDVSSKISQVSSIITENDYQLKNLMMGSKKLRKGSLKKSKYSNRNSQKNGANSESNFTNTHKKIRTQRRKNTKKKSSFKRLSETKSKKKLSIFGKQQQLGNQQDQSKEIKIQKSNSRFFKDKFKLYCKQNNIPLPYKRKRRNAINTGIKINSQNSQQNQLSKLLDSQKIGNKNLQINKNNCQTERYMKQSQVKTLTNQFQKQLPLYNIIGGDRVENSVFFIEQELIQKKQTRKLQKYLNDLMTKTGCLFEPMNIHTESEDRKKNIMLQKQRCYIFNTETEQLRKYAEKSLDFSIVQVQLK